MQLSYLHVIDLEQFQKHEDYVLARDQNSPNKEFHDKIRNERNANQRLTKEKFPHTVMVEGSYYDQDFANKWCWEHFGPRDGKCHDGEMQEWNGCPLVLATQYIAVGWYKRQDGMIVNWTEPAYKDVEDHAHEGIWATCWLGKTGYDYGISEFCFLNQQDRDSFLAAVPTFTQLQRDLGKIMSTQVVCDGVYQSRWGFHPCNREISKKLRFLNGVYAKALHLDAAWERWNRKAPWNRVVKETIRDGQGIKIGKRIVLDANGKPLPMKEPQLCPLFGQGDGEMILAASRQARTPQPTPEEVKPLSFSDEEIDRLYDLAKEWLESR